MTYLLTYAYGQTLRLVNIRWNNYVFWPSPYLKELKNWNDWEKMSSLFIILVVSKRWQSDMMVYVHP